MWTIKINLARLHEGAVARGHTATAATGRRQNVFVDDSICVTQVHKCKERIKAFFKILRYTYEF